MQGTRCRKRLNQVACHADLRVWKGRCREYLAPVLPHHRVGGRLVVEHERNLFQELERIHFDDGRQATEQIGYFSVWRDVPMFLRLVRSQVFFQLLGEDVSTISNQQVGSHLFLTLFVHARNGYIKILDGEGRDGLVAQMFAEPGEVLRKRLDEFLVELVDE